MNKINFDCKEFINEEKFHDIMYKELELPEYYGRNLDALWDLLTEYKNLVVVLKNANFLEKKLGEFGQNLLDFFDELNEIENFEVIYQNNINSSVTIKKLPGMKINIHPTSYLAEGSRIIGSVQLKKNSSVWYNAVLRGDGSPIIVGMNTNIQDNSVIHTDPGSNVILGNNVTIGHNVIIHGANIEDNVIVGMGSIVLNDAVIGSNTIIGANSLVTKGTIIPEGSLVLGSPAKVVRKLKYEEFEQIKFDCNYYLDKLESYKD